MTRRTFILIIEAVDPLLIHTKTLGSFSLLPGQRVTLPDELVRQLFERAPRKIRLIQVPSHLEPGVWIDFDSPLFGGCTAKVQAMTIKGVLVSDHSVLGPTKDVTIQAAWIRHIYKENCA